MRVASAYWARWVRERKGLSAEQRQAAQARFAAIRDKVIQLGAPAAEKRIAKIDDYDLTRAQGVLNLAMAYLEAGRADQAHKWLLDPNRGLLPLLKTSQAASFPPAFSLGIYQAALRAIVATLAAQGNSQDAQAQLSAVMQELAQRLGNDPQGRRKLMGLYVGLVQKLLEDLGRQTDAAKRAALARPLAEMLTAIAASTDDPTYLRWSGKTLLDVAEKLEGPTSRGTAAAELRQRAVKVLKRVLDLAARSPQTVGADVKLAVSYQLAKALAASGQYGQAVEQYKTVLEARPTMLAAQAGAAQAIYEWAVQEKRPELLEKSIGGMYADAKGKPIIWGWARIALVTRRYPKFRSTFHQARYYAARARYQQAKWETNAREKQAKLRKAKLAITQTYQMFPKLGGSTWRSRYDALLKAIQRELGEAPSGLRGLEQRGAARVSRRR